MKVVELEKITKHIIEVYGEHVTIAPYDYEFVIEFTEIPELESFYLDKDKIETYEDFLKIEKEEIKPALKKLCAELYKKQVALTEKIEKL